MGLKKSGVKENLHKNLTGSIMLEIKRPVSAPLSPEQAAAIQEIVARHKAVKGGLLPAMHEVQGLCGNWLPMEALQLISQGMDVPYPYLYGVMSFYTMFSPTPRGKFIIRFLRIPALPHLGSGRPCRGGQG